MINDSAKKKSFQGFWIVTVCIVVLLSLTTVLAYLHQQENKDLREDYLRIYIGDSQKAKLTVDDLSMYPKVHKNMEVNTSKGLEKHKYTGVPLLAIINGIDSGWVSEYKQIIAVGADGYTSSLKMEEVLVPDNVYIVFEDNGKKIKKMNGDEGSMQIIICEDAFGQRFTKYLVKLELKP